jgi:hypothetical protein
MRECDTVMTNPNGFEEMQLKAMGTLIKAVSVCYKLVTDIEVEDLEQEIKEIKRAEKTFTGEQQLGYTIEDPPP